jgi:ABC-type transport system involved in multi-copper enzyme maturation permease subunit
MSADIRLRLNPILVHEFERQMRSRYTHLALTVYLVVVGSLAVLLYTTSFLSSTRTVGSNGAVGAAVFYFLVGVQLILTTFIVPAIAANAISEERQSLTLDLLRITPFGGGYIVGAKLAARFGFAVLLLIVMLPLFSLAFMLGGIELRELGIAVGIVLISMLTYLLIGICVSAHAKTTASALALTYTIVLSTAIGTPLIALLNAATLFGRLPASPQDISAVLAVLLDAAINAGLGISPISTTVFALSGLASDANIWLNVSFSGSAVLPTPLVFFIAIHLISSAVCYAGAVRRVDAPD